MKKTSIILLLIVGLLPVFSQEMDRQLNIYLQNAQYKKAIEYINEQEATKEYLYQKAFCYKSLNNYSPAIEILESLSEEYPEDISVKLQLAQCYELALKYTQSIDCYEKLADMDSTNTYFQMRRADLLFRADKYDQALDEYFRIEKKDNSSYVNRSIAMCFDKLYQTDSAMVYYSRAWEIDPTDYYSATSLVKLNIRKEDYASALSNSEKFMLLDSANMQMNALNAFTYYNMDNYVEAVSRFEWCRATGDSSLIVNRGLGISYYFLEDDSCAHRYLNQAYIQDTTNNTVLYALASVNYNLEYYQESIDCYSKLIERNIPNKNALYTYFYGLGKAFEKNNSFEAALHNYQYGIQYATSNSQKMDVYYAISSIYEHQFKDYYGAIHFYKEYRVHFFNYLNSLPENDEADIAKIKELKEKLDELDKHIAYLKENSKISK